MSDSCCNSVGTIIQQQHRWSREEPYCSLLVFSLTRSHVGSYACLTECSLDCVASSFTWALDLFRLIGVIFKTTIIWSLWRNKKVGWTSSGKKAINKEHLASCSHFLCRRLWDRKRRTNEMYKSRGVKLVQGSLWLSQKQLLFKVTWERPASLHSSSTRINIFSDRYLNNLKNDFFSPLFLFFPIPLGLITLGKLQR